MLNKEYIPKLAEYNKKYFKKVLKKYWSKYSKMINKNCTINEYYEFLNRDIKELKSSNYLSSTNVEVYEGLKELKQLLKNKEKCFLIDMEFKKHKYGIK